ncbi:hypothetical protein B2G71_06295 [Novosphingobium sp. PC22D]|uniref:AMP-binding protein n=1 Tax=Novosphingobium sp. PC22D TaxID=1962403 RepID=UPI000BF0B998|nr:AMP-binding protein [Novosphingobium sp. PC22D]PEQ13907.1 hypothetical protein B2G71_06295 [Novosphingobium sp. PC22D]
MTTFHDFLRAGAERHGERLALMIDDARLSHADLLARGEAAAAALVSAGLGPHDSVALLMDNSLECVLAWLASSLVGCTEVPLNPQYRGDLLEYLLSDSEVSVVVCDAAYLGHVLELADRLPHLRMVLVNGGAQDTRAGHAGIAALDLDGDPQGFAGVDEAPERIILYTSGTTGRSKGVVHSQAAMLGLSRYNAQVMGYGPDDRLLNFFPLFHQNARYTGVIPALCAGAAIRIQRRLSTSTFWQTCREDGITAFNYLGSVLRMILNVTEPGFGPEAHSIRKAFGAGAAPGVWEAFEEQLGIALYETYGLSEAPMATLNVPQARSPRGSAGRASDLFEVAVFDEADVPVPAGTIGEIVLRPRRANAFMLGYHNQAEATVAALRNLWFHSGDRGMLSQDGDLFFEERAKDSIRRRGENISAWEVESILEKHPDVAEAAVYGLVCEDADEEVAASIVAAGEGADLDAIFAFARERLPIFAVPTLMRLATDLPRTPTAKVRKEELRRIARDSYTPMPPSGRPQAATATER